jgi:hypothetical protein
LNLLWKTSILIWNTSFNSSSRDFRFNLTGLLAAEEVQNQESACEEKYVQGCSGEDNLDVEPSLRAILNQADDKEYDEGDEAAKEKGTLQDIQDVFENRY